MVFSFIVHGIISYTKQVTYNDDLSERVISSRIEQSERRIQSEVQRTIDRQIADIISGDIGETNQVIAKLLAERLDSGVVAAVQDAVGRQLDLAAREARRWQHIENTFDRIRTKLDGPASRAEVAANRFRNAAMLICFFGLGLACLRLWGEGDFVDRILPLATAENSSAVWMVVFAKAAPWVGVILLAEFTALLFFRAYQRAIELQRYFTRELAILEARFAGLRVILDLGTPDQQYDVVKALMAAEANILSPDAGTPDPATVSSILSAIGAAVKDFKPSAAPPGAGKD
ncbi:hypothetical protein NS226_15370 [Aureimonas ureilytica]|uniref:Uncharacterized protein n=1 Tax=Aureimonas ureilytica TaxID=401562 RepID=A0A175R5R7_9HYPH|nr:hypothetical protein NS226_15370 [Aureimonas ureilytica]